MIFDEFIAQIEQTAYKLLPGSISHNKIMNPIIRQLLYKDYNNGKPPRESAVLALLYPDVHNNVKMVFILRKTYDGHHSGQIAFPGGKKEDFDSGLLDTALREAQEEIGINPEQVKFVKQLTKLHIPVSNFDVQAYLAYTPQTPSFVKDPAEVEDILELSFEAILNNKLVSIQRVYNDKPYELNAFDFDGLKIWGATAMILSEIVDLFKKR